MISDKTKFKCGTMSPVFITELPYVTFALKGYLPLHFNAHWASLTGCYNEHPVTASRFLCIKLIDSSVKKLKGRSVLVMYMITRGNRRVSKSSLKFKGSFTLGEIEFFP